MPGLRVCEGVLLRVVRKRVPEVRHDASELAAVAGGSADPLALLHERTARIVAELRQARSTLEAASPRMLASAIRAFRRTEGRLKSPLRVAIVGEFNSGKSSLANLLARTESLPTAVVSNTRFPTLLHYSDEPEIWAVDRRGKRQWLRADQRTLPASIFRLEVGLPTRRLRTVQILDLPGLADPRLGSAVDIADHGVHGVLWCTMSTQAWKESERIAWAGLPARLRACALLVSTHADLLQGPHDADKLSQRLRSEGAGLFQDIVLVSTLDALKLLRGRQQGRAEDAWKATGAEALEGALQQLFSSLRDRRAEAALRMTGRIADRALARLEVRG
jgi:hypothetical protein